MIATISSHPRLRRGLRLGKYQLDSRLGEGGFSQVWKARDTLEGQAVALKIPHPFRPGSAEEAELLEEIRLSAKLRHPNILRIRNADRIGDLYVIASDLALESLDERLQRRLSTGRALSYTSQILQGLAYAHEHRVIHRDIKPSNLMLYAGDKLRIADFGLARVAKHTMISATGSGSLLYIAPEQAHGYPCFASDVFSVGLICHQMLSGRLPRWPFEWPFEGEDVLRSKVPVELINVIRKATHLDHRHRYRDAGEMLAAFQRIASAVRKFLNPAAPPRRRRRQLGAWRQLRFREFERAFGKLLHLHFECPDCRGPISEHMSACPWCGAGGLHFAERTEFPCFCSRCKRGLRHEWRFCPWCWGPSFPGAGGEVRPDPRYHGACRECDGPLIEGMHYCPWCHAKCSKPVRIAELADTCPRCKGSVARDFWEHCPWCSGRLPKTPTRR
jgi:hypothetical protein